MQLTWLLLLNHKSRLFSKNRDQYCGKCEGKANAVLSFFSCWITYHSLAAWCSIEVKQALRGPPLRDQGRSVRFQVQRMLTFKPQAAYKVLGWGNYITLTQMLRKRMTEPNLTSGCKWVPNPYMLCSQSGKPDVQMRDFSFLTNIFASCRKPEAP